VIDHIKHIVDEDEEEIKAISNTLPIKVFPAREDIIDLDLIEIKRNKID